MWLAKAVQLDPDAVQTSWLVTAVQQASSKRKREQVWSDKLNARESDLIYMIAVSK